MPQKYGVWGNTPVCHAPEAGVWGNMPQKYADESVASRNGRCEAYRDKGTGALE